MSAREALVDARAGVRLIAESIERGLNTIGKDETQMTVKRQDVEDLREVLEEIERLTAERDDGSSFEKYEGS